MNFDLNKAKWLCEPKTFSIKDNTLTMVTEAGTDLWQRTYYGFQNDNAHVLYLPIKETFFTFSFKVSWACSVMFDQCGIAIYQNSNHWVKSGLEYKDSEGGWLGSVVTNNGFSDWATTEVKGGITEMWYRLSRRESDFLIENSLDGVTYKQMRIFHFFAGAQEVNVGMLACSPKESSFTATFSEINLGDCLWESHR